MKNVKKLLTTVNLLLSYIRIYALSVQWIVGIFLHIENCWSFTAFRKAELPEDPTHPELNARNPPTLGNSGNSHQWDRGKCI